MRYALAALAALTVALAAPARADGSMAPIAHAVAHATDIQTAATEGRLTADEQVWLAQARLDLEQLRALSDAQAAPAQGAAGTDTGSLPPPPTTLCAIGQAGNWCFGILPGFDAFGIDVTHGKVVLMAAASIAPAATWMPGQLKSITIGPKVALAKDAVAGDTANLGLELAFLKAYARIGFDWQAIGGSHAFVIKPLGLGVPF